MLAASIMLAECHLAPFKNSCRSRWLQMQHDFSSLVVVASATQYPKEPGSAPNEFHITLHGRSLTGPFAVRTRLAPSKDWAKPCRWSGLRQWCGTGGQTGSRAWRCCKLRKLLALASPRPPSCWAAGSSRKKSCKPCRHCEMQARLFPMPAPFPPGGGPLSSSNDLVSRPGLQKMISQ